MTHALVEIRGGGIFLRNPTEESKNGLYDFSFLENEQGISEKFFKIIRTQSLQGLVSYLLGERKKIKEIDKCIDDKDRKSLIEHQMYIYSKEIESKHDKTSAFIQSMYERRDLVYNEKSLKKNPQVNMKNYSWEEASPIVQFFKENLIEVTSQKSLEGVFTQMKTSFSDFKKIFSICKKKNDTLWFETIDISENDRIEIPTNASHKFADVIGKINDKIDYFLQAKKEQSLVNITSNQVPFYPEYVALIKSIKSGLKNNLFPLTFIKEAAWSCFDTSLEHSKNWIDSNLRMHVRGAPAYLLNLDFDLYFENLTDSQYQRLLSGPRMAYWGEGGVAKLIFIDGPLPSHAETKFSDFENSEKNLYPVKSINYNTKLGYK
jgi:hypothetical protein